MSQVLMLLLLQKKVVKAEHAVHQGYVIRIIKVFSDLLEAMFFDDAACQDKLAFSYDSREVIQEILFGFTIWKNSKRALLLPDFIIMQDDLIVTKVLEFEGFESWDYFLCIVLLVKDAKCQDKDGIAWIYR